MLIFNLDLNELLIIKWIRKEKENTENKNIDDLNFQQIPMSEPSKYK